MTLFSMNNKEVELRDEKKAEEKKREKFVVIKEAIVRNERNT